MRFTPTPVAGAWIVETDPVHDDRGFFARVYCRDTFLAHGIDLPVPQINTAFNARRGTLRGMHYQAPPHAEGKLIRCIAGAVFDVILDIRRDSASCGQWFGVDLSAEGGNALYVPPGCAHGYVSLTERSELFYLMSTAQASTSARGIRWNDARFAVAWPIEPVVMSERDRGWPDWAG